MILLDVDQLGKVNNVDLNANDVVKQMVENKVSGPLQAQKIMVLILPAAVLAFVGMMGKVYIKIGSNFIIIN